MKGLFSIKAAVRSDIGKVRVRNEDNFYFIGRYMEPDEADGGMRLYFEGEAQGASFAVCDGVGGAAAGEVASLLAAAGLGMLQPGAKARHIELESGLELYAREVNARMLELSHGEQMGSTLALLALNPGGSVVAHLGDSRVYLLREGGLERLTTDHTKVQRLFTMGLITEAELETHPEGNIITAYLGTLEEGGMPPETSEVEVRPGDRFLICSDGLTGMVDCGRIHECLGYEDVRAACEALVDAALLGGGRDNVTAIVLDVERV